MLSIKLAEDIVAQTMMRLHHNINVIDIDGVILASGERGRVDSIHEGAIEVAKTGKPLYIETDEQAAFYRCKHGINLPITFHDKIVGVIGITGNPVELQEIASLVQLTTEMMVHQVLTEGKSEWQRKNGEFIVRALFNGEALDDALQQRIQKLPFPFTPPFQLLLLQPIAFTTSNKLMLQLENILYRQEALYGQTAFNEYYVLLCGESVEAMSSIVRRLQQLPAKLAVQIGISVAVTAIEELPFVLKSAQMALRQACVIRPVVSFVDIHVQALLKDPACDEVQYFLRHMPKLSQKLLTTLETFLSCNLQLAVCAEQLGIHRHTLTYRLQQIEEQTGYHPQRFHDAFLLKLMVLLQQSERPKKTDLE